MKKLHILYLAITALTLGGCGSAGSSLANAITDPLTPKPHGKTTLAINDQNGNGLLRTGNDVADTINIAGRNYGNNSTLDIGHLWQNRLTNFQYILKANGRNLEDGQLEVYKRSYSAIVGAHVRNRYAPDGTQQQAQPNEFQIRSIQGTLTQENQLPTTGTVRYQGHAFAGSDERNGRLDYSINYGGRTGSGQITGLPDFGNITLRTGNLDRHNSNITGVAESQRRGNGNYHLNIFGPNANEIAGKAHNFTTQQNGGNLIYNREVGFSGGRVN